MSDERLILAFFTSKRSGPGRRMESLLAQLAHRERARLRVLRVDADEWPDLVERFSVSAVPTLVLVRGRRIVSRLEGRVSAPRIERMLAEQLEATADAQAA